MSCGPWKNPSDRSRADRATKLQPFKTYKAKPHMVSGLTKEMLMGARAPVAKLRRVEQ